MPGGALGVPHGEEIVPMINRLIPHFEHIVATMDWHPRNHVSFSIWPSHCIQNTWGAALVNTLNQNRIEALFHKGMDPDVDSYSVFLDMKKRPATALAEYLHKRELRDLYFCGLATDYCIFHSVLDALALGFTVSVIRDACRGIDRRPGDIERTLCHMAQAGAHIISSITCL
jgi:nicotinamidase/pyrazinamidase